MAGTIPPLAAPAARLRRCLAGGAALAALTLAPAAQAQFAAPRRIPGAAAPQPLTRTDPVAFTADEVQYDRDNAVVSATGNVEAWQNDNILRADKITFDRNTNVAAASGHVVIVQPDGQVLFSDYAELTEGLRDGVLRGMRAILAENGRLVANGARRTDGKINELSRAIYTTCNLCAADPTKPPLWQIRARSIVQDGENKRIEYRDAVVDIYGVPVAYLPYIWHTDPSVRRASGFLVPDFGSSKHLGGFLRAPYFWAIDEQSDATITPTLNTQNYLNVNTDYRRRFNDGTLRVDGALGIDRRKPQAAIFARGAFAYDDTWRYGFNIDRASSSKYLNDYSFTGRGDVLTSSIFLEGFGTGAYTRLDSIAYQGLVNSISQARLPYVLPRYQYSFFGEPDALGGRLSFETVDFNVVRQIGTNTQRAGAVLNWQRPFAGVFGEAYGLTLQNVAAGYTATSLNQNPNYARVGSAETARDHPQAAIEVRWPLVRDGGELGTQTIEPIAQFVAGPNTGGGQRTLRVPNEDSLDFEFTDQNLFSLNKYPGIDRLEGGLRANVGLHLNWSVGTAAVDALVGQSYRAHRDDTFPVGSGLERRASDIVTRTTVTPAPWLDLTGRTRVDNRNGNIRFADAIGSTGTPLLRLNAGYIYSAVNPYFYYDTQAVPASYLQHRNEVTAGVNSQLGRYRLGATARRDVNTNKMVSAGLRATYEDECFIFDANFIRRYTSLNGDNGASTFLLQITLKTVGQFGFHPS
ncbi:MAG TPA: LPS assembly protein LptD [Acetobacteraceae bacterium]